MLQKLMDQKSLFTIYIITNYINCSKNVSPASQSGVTLYVILHEIVQLKIPNLAHYELLPG